MLKALFRLLFRLRGWQLYQPMPPKAKHCIMIAAPHTSNWDFVYTMAALELLGIDARFTIKREFNRWPFGRWMESLGALWIDRRPKQPGEARPSMVQAMVDLLEARRNQPMAMIVTPEGTRSLREEWRTGFYHVAVQSGLPICLAFMDYEKRICGVGLCIKPSGDLDADMGQIMDFYRDKQGKYPEKFSLDRRFGRGVGE